jgi:hypothetical protein
VRERVKTSTKERAAPDERASVQGNTGGSTRANVVGNDENERN